MDLIILGLGGLPLIYLAISTLVAARSQPVVSNGAVPKYRASHLPVVGSAFPFFRSRASMLASKDCFSFFVGRKHIVNLGGVEGRRTFFESKSLSLPHGAIEFLIGSVTPIDDDPDDHGAQEFIRSLAALTRPSNLARQLPVLMADIRAFQGRLAQAAPSKECPSWRVLDPFESIYSFIFRLILRVVGIAEWLEDEAVLGRMLSAFCGFEKNFSSVHLVFPWLPTPTYVKKLFHAAVLYTSINKIVKRRKETGKKQDDALQFLIDHDKDIIRSLLSVLSSGITTEGCAAAWLLVFLAHSPEWQARCRAEIDGVISQKRREGQSSQSKYDVLESLTLPEWETGFPVMLAAFRETVRLAMPGAMFRKNISGGAVPIGKTGEVIPDGAYASFLMDNVHMDPDLYPEPFQFNPGRHLSPDGGSGEKQEELEPHTYIGWGTGRHPCAGMRLAKLEITMLMASLVAHFEFQPSDAQGSKTTGEFPLVHRNGHRMEKPKTPVYLRYKERK
ncbi:hypothetical protein PG996_006349 [Apiospora saccharicola]|uniref:Cytochrome P450 n=1 Tax=Apiospora saccharicola TaxID=335842 RepID=A0ABR1VP14_9PEZI